MSYKESTTSDWSTAQNVTNLSSEGNWEALPLSSKVKVGTPPQKPKVINSKTVFIIGNGESRIGLDLEELRDYGKIYGCNLFYEEFTPDALVAVDERIMHPCYWSGYPMENVCWFRDWRPMPGEAYELLTDSSIVSADSTIDMSEYIYTNSRNDSTEFVMHGTNIDRAAEYEKEVRELDKNNVIDESALNLVFRAGIYTTWLNTNGDKVKNMGAGSFPPEFLKEHLALYRNLVELAIEGREGAPAMNAGPTAQLISSLVEKPTDIYLIGMDIHSYNDRVNNIYKGRDGYMTETGNVVPSANFLAQHKDLFTLFPQIKHYKVNQYPLGTDVINQEIKERKNTHNLEYLTYAEMIGRLTNR